MIFLFSIFGCRSEIKSSEPTIEPSTEVFDLDGDGYFSDEDCDDGDDQIYPGAQEICDGLDNSCDGLVDEGVTNTYFADTDQDGFGDETDAMEACDPPTGYVSTGGDCDDNEASVYPAAAEVCDGVDNNCEGTPDEGMGVFFYADNDRDGFGDDTNLIESCVLGEGMSAIAGDCDDTNASVNPLAQEFCDGADNDCDGTTDEGVQILFYQDFDEDGFGSETETTLSCIAPEGYLAQGGDCNDSDTLINPNAIEICDAQDNNCDGNSDEAEAIDASLWYRDADSDGFGTLLITQEACSQPTGYVTDNTDCNDSNNSVHPDAIEYCNNIDDNCNEETDELGANGGITLYEDNDGDGFGNSNLSFSACAQESGYSTAANDCNDNNDAVHPNAVEICNNLDDNCDGSIDNNASNMSNWFLDGDGDGYGTGAAEAYCNAPTGYAQSSGDCDDANAGIYPTATELCDGIDSDCDGLSDDADASDRSIFYLDYDGDGYGNPSFSTLLCSDNGTYVANNTDCDDLRDQVYPGKDEICDGLDNDCDGFTDDQDSLILNAPTWYADSDSDGYGSNSLTIAACTQPNNYIDINGDCNDANANINPDANDIPYDGVDQDCDGGSDFDADGDGVDSFLEVGGGDCNDFNPTSTGCGLDQSSAIANCSALYDLDPSLPDGIYWLDPDEDGDTGDAWLGYCDMTRDGGGWTLVLQNNVGVSHSNAVSYSNAILSNNVLGGTLTETSALSSFDVLVGLSNWNDLGHNTRIEVGAVAGTPDKQAFYTISLNENDGFRLSLTSQTSLVGTSTAPGIASYHSGRRFTTYDTDQDDYGSNCSHLYSSAPWWYGGCWSGSFWGYNSNDKAYWSTSSSGDTNNWGAIWIHE